MLPLGRYLTIFRRDMHAVRAGKKAHRPHLLQDDAARGDLQRIGHRRQLRQILHPQPADGIDGRGEFFMQSLFGRKALDGDAQDLEQALSGLEGGVEVVHHAIDQHFELTEPAAVQHLDDMLCSAAVISAIASPLRPFNSSASAASR